MNYPKLDTLTQEMHHIISLLNPFDYLIRPATTTQIFKDSLTKYKPNIVLWSGHNLNIGLAVENDKGRLDIYEKKEFIDNLNTLEGVKLVILLSCYSHDIIPNRKHPIHNKCSFISVPTLTEDSAVCAFLSGVIIQLSNQLKHTNSNIDIRQIFEGGCTSFKANGYKFGTPEDYLHTDNTTAHPGGLMFKGCPGCIPPVQGDVCLTLSKDLNDGDDYEIRGSSNTYTKVEISTAKELVDFSSRYKYDAEAIALGLQKTQAEKSALEAEQAEIENAAQILTTLTKPKM
tara:strand:- start:1349 stop:2209 length:861 start_codon:yes stop_codon:yes gene_type:complete